MFGLLRSGVLIFACLAGSCATAAARENEARYLLGPQDKLKVRVYDWRVSNYDTHEWPALTGEFIVGASGDVSFPIVGELSATGKTPADLASAIATRLRFKVGLAQTPFASVEVLEYRPFYIVGNVEKPGAYPFRPSLTVLQAVGIGGGTERLTESARLAEEKEALRDRGEIDVLEAERRQLIVRQARVEADLGDLDAVKWPAEITDHVSDPVMRRAMHEESVVFANRRMSRDVLVKTAQQNKQILQDELVSLSAKDVVMRTQEKLAKDELNLVAGLVARGLAGVPRQNAIQQNISQLASIHIDLDLSRLRARKDLVVVDRDLTDAENKARAQVLSEQAEVRSRLSVLNARVASLQESLRQAERRAAMESGTRVKIVTRYSVAREVNEVMTYLDVDESYHLQPGDTLRLRKERDETSYMESSNR